jgi:hypothetical protein
MAEVHGRIDFFGMLGIVIGGQNVHENTNQHGVHWMGIVSSKKNREQKETGPDKFQRRVWKISSYRSGKSKLRLRRHWVLEQKE